MSPNKSPGKRGRAPVPQPTTTRRVTRSQSPTKPKIIADSPPPEDRMNPFPPQRAPMTVSDKPAVYNRYGEKVPAPADIAQKLRQAENFLSDEGPENCADFEDKLIRLDTWLEKHHVLGDNVSPEGDQETEERYRKVKWMIWVHKERLTEGAEQWFTRNQFPDSKSMIKPIKPHKEDQWRVTPDGVATSVPLHPKLQVMLAQDRERIPKERAERAKAVAAAKEAAKARSSQTVAAKASAAVENDSEAEAESEDEKLPSLPYPEVWHRKEAARFPYGETTHMELVMSNQISADLARGKSYDKNKPMIQLTHDLQEEKPKKPCKVATCVRCGRPLATSGPLPLKKTRVLPSTLGHCLRYHSMKSSKRTSKSSTISANACRLFQRHLRRRERPRLRLTSRLLSVTDLAFEVDGVEHSISGKEKAGVQFGFVISLRFRISGHHIIICYWFHYLLCPSRCVSVSVNSNMYYGS